MHKLYDSNAKEWDKDSIARYIFVNREKMTPEQVSSFFRYAKMTKRIREDIEKFKEKRYASVPVVQKPEVTVVKAPENNVPAVTDLNPQVAALLRTCKELNLPIQFNIAQGDIVGFKANESYGDNYSVLPGAKVETKNDE